MTHFPYSFKKFKGWQVFDNLIIVIMIIIMIIILFVLILFIAIVIMHPVISCTSFCIDLHVISGGTLCAFYMLLDFVV